MDANDKTNLRESKVDHDVDAGGGQGKQGKDSGCVICAPLGREKKNLWGEIIFILIISNISSTWNKLFTKPQEKLTLVSIVFPFRLCQSNWVLNKIISLVIECFTSMIFFR